MAAIFVDAFSILFVHFLDFLGVFIGAFPFLILWGFQAAPALTTNR